MRIGGSMSMNAHVHKGSGWWGGEATLKNGKLDEFHELFWTTHSAHQETTALVELTYCSGV